MKYIKYLYLIALSLFVLSCYKDKGNYKYNEYNKIKIENVASGYDVVVFSTLLEIDPIIENPDNYDYLWRIYSNSQSFASPDTLGYERKLSTKINLSADNYTLMLEVKDKKTGYTEYCRSSVNGSTAFSTGWYIFKEQDNMCDLDLHTSTGLMEDLLLNKFKKRLKGNGGRLSIMAAYSYIDAKGVIQRATPVLCPFTDDESYILKISDLSIVYDQNTMFFERPENSIVNHFQQGGSYFCNFMTNKGVYYINAKMSGSSGRFGLPATVSMENGSDMDVSRYSYLPSHTFGSIYFDRKNNRFFQMNFSGAAAEFMDEDTDINKSTNIDMDLMFMGRTGGVGNAVFKNESGSEVYIYTLDFPPFSSGNPISDVHLVEPNLKIYQGKLFANNFNLPIIYYSSGDNAVHSYRCEAKKETVDIIRFPAGENVTFIQNVSCSINSDTERAFDYLVVGTYKDGKYNVYRYEMLAGIPDPDKTPSVLSGSGKAISVQYSSSKLSTNNYSFD